MSFFKFLEHVGNGVAQSIALKQATEGTDTAVVGTGSRKLKRSGKSKESCTPCAAMGDVDTMRKTLGFSTK